MPELDLTIETRALPGIGSSALLVPKPKSAERPKLSDPAANDKNV